MVLRDGLGPVTGPVEQLPQELPGVGGVRLRIEGDIERRKGIRMMHQIHLTAADVNRLHATRLHAMHRRNGLGLRVVEIASPLGIGGPWPWMQIAGPWVVPSALHPANSG